MCCFCCGSRSSKHEIILNKGKRSCTDCPFLLIFLLFCGGLGTITWYGLSHGDPYAIVYGSDSFGNTCGRPNLPVFIRNTNSTTETYPLSGQDMSALKYLFPLNITRPLDSVWICVRECPTKAIVSYSGIVDEYEQKNNSLCVSQEISSTAAQNPQFQRFGVCPKLPVMKSISIINRCIPEDVLTLGQELARKIVEMDWLRSYITDIVNSFSFILKMCLIAAGFSLLMVFLLRFFAGVIVNFIYLFIIVVFIGISLALWYSVVLVLDKQHDGSDSLSLDSEAQKAAFDLHRLNVTDIFRLDNVSPATAIALASGASIITVFVIMFLWCFYSRSEKLIDLFKNASKALKAMPILLFQPIVSALFVIIIALYSMSSAFILITAGESVLRDLSDGMDTVQVVDKNVTVVLKFMMGCQFVGFLWLIEFSFACQRLFIAGAISNWYFNSRRSESGQVRSAVCTSFFNLIRYHLGSAAFGSFVITLVRFPRYVLMYIYAKMKAVENPWAKRLLACFICILKCVESCLNYITNHTYTVIAYSGLSFCPAAKVAVNTLLDEAVVAVMASSVGWTVLFLAKFIVASATAAIALYQDLEVTHQWLPVLVVFICSYLVANCFLSVYDMAIDTLLLCCAEDAELSRHRPDHELSNREFQNMINSSARNRTARHGDATEMQPLRT